MSTPLPSSVDLAIIGGGINGAGLAAQAAQAGLSVVLFEKGDFASGTSSRSTKLAHGGIRYLEQGRFHLVFEALHERKRLLETMPHLVHPLGFLLPCYDRDSIAPWKLKIGLWLYDLLAGSSKWAKHGWFSPAQTLERAPALGQQGLKGCGLYYDAQVNDARLVLENILCAQAAGASCLNYYEVTRAQPSPSGIDISYQDERTGTQGTLRSSCLVNASGPWANQTSKLIRPTSGPLVRPTRGTHIVVPQVLAEHAVLIKTQKDDRVIFVIPWRGHSLVGTTDLDDPQDPDRVRPTEEEIDYLLKEASRIFPQVSWSRNRVIAAFAGLRPLAWSAGGHASSVSREDRILEEGPVLTVVGGKLTTYHAMAAKLLTRVLQRIGKSASSTKASKFPGTPSKPWSVFLLEDVAGWPKTHNIDPSQALHLAGLYGRRATEVLELGKKEPWLMERLHPDRPEICAQVLFAVQEEKAVHLEDILLRRMEWGYSPQRWGKGSEKASRVMAQALGWDETRRGLELERYRQQLFPSPL